jgi:hypothetical protein
MSKSYVPLQSQQLAWILLAGTLLALCLSANAAETPSERCERATNIEAAIVACSSAIQTDNMAIAGVNGHSPPTSYTISE